ncbi:uncharacterized protein LOC144139021 isoform X2 [Haemaphysalis longicornis]
MKFLLTTASLLLVYICCVTTTNYSTRRRPSLFCNMTSANRTKVLKCFGEKYPKFNKILNKTLGPSYRVYLGDFLCYYADMQAKWRKNYTVIQKGEVDNVTGWATPPKNPYEHTNWTWQNLQDFQRLWNSPIPGKMM